LKLVKTIKQKKNEVQGKVSLLACGIIVKEFDVVISELEKVVLQKKKYYNSGFWKKPLRIKFDCEADKSNVRKFALDRKKYKKINETDLDYIIGMGRFKDFGLLPYIKSCRDKKIELLMKDLGVDKETVLVKAEEAVTKGKELSKREAKTVKSSAFKKQASELEKELKQKKVI